MLVGSPLDLRKAVSTDAVLIRLWPMTRGYRRYSVSKVIGCRLAAFSQPVPWRPMAARTQSRAPVRGEILESRTNGFVQAFEFVHVVAEFSAMMQIVDARSYVLNILVWFHQRIPVLPRNAAPCASDQCL